MNDGRGTSGGAAGASGGGDLPFFAASAVLAVAITLFNVLNVVHERAAVGRPIAAWEPAIWEASSAVVLLTLLPLITWTTRRAWPLAPPWPRQFAIHLATAIGVSLVHVLAMGTIRGVIYELVGADYDRWGPLANWPYELRQDLPVYAAMVASYVGWRSLRAPPPVAKGDERTLQALEVRDGARRHFIPLAEVDWVEAAGNYVELHRPSGSVLHRSSLADLERRLRDAGFVRIHRSRLVRRGAVSQVESRPSGDFVVRLSRGVELSGSRRYRRPLLEP